MAVFIEYPVLPDLFHNLPNVHPLSFYTERSRGAGLRPGIVLRPPFPMKPDVIAVFLRFMVRAYCGTGAAADTAGSHIEQAGIRLPGFRIGAPSAPERASLQEHHRADPFSVMNAVSLDVKYISSHHILSSYECSADDLILNVLIQFHEKGAVPCHPNHQAPVFLRMLLGLHQLLR